MSSAAAASSRIVSMDQFRGYTVTGMLIVNFLGHFAISHPVLSHHNTYFSYADTIMPAFHFAVGFALRLTMLRRIQKSGTRAAYARGMKRCLGLVLLATVILLADESHPFKTWADLQKIGVWGVLAQVLKGDLWETLTLIGVTSIWVLPVIARSAHVRLLFLAGCIILHILICQLFYFDFLHARPNWLDQYWGAVHVRGFDGGPFAFLAWAIPQLIGSFAYDMVAREQKRSTVVRLLFVSIILMGAGYGLSCLSTLYPLTSPPADDEGGIRIAESPVVPLQPELAGRNFESFLADAPFVQPRPEDQRQISYWLMGKRVVTLPFSLFSSGFALGIYALCVLLCDLGGVQIGIFRTFGQNALAAYIIHEVVNKAIKVYAPADSPYWWALGSFGLFFGITYLFVRSLEKNGIYLRL